jgi:hypothetical protein
MIFGLFVLFTALLISGVAAWYSIVGLMAIFSGATLAIAIMGGVLEVGKLVTASWLYNYWNTIPKFLKIYLTGAVIGLMFITSMGIFGFLSKAHLEQTAMSGEQVAQITVYESKLIRSGAKITRWTDEIDRLNKGENIRIDNIVAGEEEQLQRLYTRIDTEKESLRLTANGVVEIQQERLQDSDQRTKDDIALVNNREGDNQEEIDVIRKRERGVAWVARRDIGKIQNQLKIDLLGVDKRYASDVDAVNKRIATLKEQSNLKTEDIDTRINALESFIETEQVLVDKARENKLVLEKTYRQLEVEVGPVKYIAEFIYGDNAPSMLDSAVRGVILLLIFVFDPLAVLLIIAGNITIRQAISSRESSLELPKSDPPVNYTKSTTVITPTWTKELVKDMELDIEVAQNLGILKEKKDDVIPKEDPIKEEELKEVLEEADPEVREEVAKKLEEESQTVLVNKENTPILEPLIKKGKSLLTSIVSGKSKKISWIDTPHEPKH